MMPLKHDSQVRNAFAALKSLGASDANTPQEVSAPTAMFTSCLTSYHGLR
jgi:hypothetical protein